ncbi:uncharacterized protein LOC135959862 [Calliphora vicina]|uniref:uncharacterized protein LOC135959862 n=1 Tax=Calliphora vicina TaxID=7373 RepID=UPI00325B87E2
MSCYRDLNKELIGQVQTMRHDLKLYCDEIVHLKGELMQKHESEVLLRKDCYTWALESFIQLIQHVQPESDILPVLKEFWRPQDRTSATSTYSRESRSPRRTRISGERSSGSTRRRSSQLTAEFQRSTSIINTRNSVCSTSPIRRSSNEAAEAEPAEEELEGEEDEDCENVVESVTNPTELPQEQPDENLNIIYEHSENDEDEEDDTEDAVTVYESVEEVSVDEVSISKTRTTLKDVTNTDTSSIKVAPKRGRPKKVKKKVIKNKVNQENSTDDMGSESEVEQSRSLHQTEIADKSLEEPRRHSNARHVSMINKSIPTYATRSYCNHSREEVTIASPTSVYTDMTLRNFNDAACSTPNSRHNSLQKPVTPPAYTGTTYNLTTESESVTSNTLNCRPSRQCKPKDLAEPKLTTKLRNETVKESITKKKSRSKTRTKN